ncbi:MAG TPA: N-acetyltransferase [Edaphobacter sp.]
MSKGIEFREYRRDDLEALVELDEECFAPPFRFSRRAMQRFAEAGNAWVRVGEEDGRLAGFCIVHRESAGVAEMGYVVTIDVARPLRGRGIGERMLSEGEAWVESWSGAGVMLHVFVENERAVRFYERVGYARVGMQQGFYGSGLDAAMYWKDLSPVEP